MKFTVFFLRLFAFCSLVLPVKLSGQVPDWENAVTLQNTSSVACATSDAYGQHILIPDGPVFKHFLLGNDGIKISSNSEHVTPPRNGSESESGASITNFGGVVSIVAQNNNNQLNLYQSADGGAYWTGPTTPPAFSGTPYNVDAFADGRGVHVVYDNNVDKVYYIRRNTDGLWTNPFEITNLNGTPISGYRPKVVTSANKVIVSFVKKQSLPLYYVGSTREYDFTTSLWDNTDRPTGSMDNASIFNQSIIRRGSMLHMVMRRLFITFPI